MKLRTKFFVGTTILMTIYSLIMFFLPRYLIRKDIFLVADKIHDLELQKDQALVKDQKALLLDILQSRSQAINAFLFMVYERPGLQKALTFPTASDSKEESAKILQKNWEMLTHLASFNPSYGFLQLDSIDGQQHATLTPEEANLYAIETNFLGDHMLLSVIFLHDNSKYLGIPIQIFSSNYDPYVILFPWPEDDSKIQIMKAQVKRVMDTFHMPKSLDAAQIFTDPTIANERSIRWALTLKMLQALVPFVFDGQSPAIRPTPSGIALLRPKESAVAILTKEAIHTEGLAQAQEFYALHQPPPSSPPLGNDNLLIAIKDLHHIFLANTMKAENFYFTLGASIDTLAEQVALWSNKIVLIRVKDQVWMGFGQNGVRYSEEQINQFGKGVQTGGSDVLLELQNDAVSILNKPTGFIQIGAKTYKFSNIFNFQNGELGFYELSNPADAPIAQYAIDAGQQLTQKILLQIYIISFVMISLIFATIARMATINAIRPVRALAAATETVAKGDYSHVVLPDVGKRNDEMAVLVHSFGTMIESLQEKEKIRGVLNKVVSKAIAEEILKSDIQLGGEDRYVTVLFADIRHFTQMTRDMTPQQTIMMLNTVMTKLTQIIEGEGGVIDKYIGDEVMAIFGAPQKNEKHALSAVSAGVMMVTTMIKWNEGRVSQGEFPIRIGVGIHSGIVVAGNMGAADRLNYTVLGTNVNLASRLCQAAEAKQVLISTQTLQEPGVQDAFKIKTLAPIEVKGFDHPIPVYQAQDFKWKNPTEDPT